MAEKKSKAKNKGGRPRNSMPGNVRSITMHEDVDRFLIDLKQATGIPINTLVNSILRGYFTDRNAGQSMTLGIHPDYTVSVPIQWPSRPPEGNE